ncbi:RNA polymerase sigma-70 factor, ECF subfamily [Singulisphaera sp. GP187]|uniref:sigma-70 family RNA polymerase sigma factor n=1 Tax=Singulisphaera sp. GP187 TaxID=1882752 RepID=UPI0009282F46|nr:sigma-70 family RNA polymerase sigma factor [Singulisphaera sp. GP187]SIO60724.1 RNA polymerase sigma-70 factor, ECF subfamily [Singulisphaera sp. GP187]
MAINDSDTDILLRQVGDGDPEAMGRLLEKYRPRLKQMVAVRLDRRVSSRLDPSDVVRDALADAGMNLGEYLREPPLPFYPWLRRFAMERVIQLHRHHLYTDKRSSLREQTADAFLPDETTLQLADMLASSQSTPSQQVIRGELCQQVRQLLDRLAPRDREVLVLRYLEDLSFPEIASAVGLNEGAVKMRHLRALERIRVLLNSNGEVPN